ncbi:MULTISPECIES: transporter substrate-binding domain-containing protein [Sulfurimonas]|uniref:ATP-binding protein n=1 Tax=Sulfurimonas TaxID=202746 RepID=UPI0012646BE5|nr:transporter substrate-binding domain-containing protein [Sulfurimonas indica]
MHIFHWLVLCALFSTTLFSSISLQLNDKEKTWLEQHKMIKHTGDPDWLPFEAFTQKGEYIGIISDGLNVIEANTGLKFKVLPSTSWNESLEMLKSGKVDMLTETTDSYLRKNYLFTKAFLSNSIVIIMRTRSSYIDNIEQLRDKKIVMIKDYGYVHKIEEKYKNIHFYKVRNIQEGLEAIATGKYDVMLVTMALGSYAIHAMQLSNVQIVGKTEFTTQVGFAINPKDKPLVGILNKAFDSLDEPTKQAILSNWITHKYVEKIDYKMIWQVAIISFLIVTAVLLWTLRLKREIRRRIKLEKENQEMLVQQAKHAVLGEMMDAVAHQWKQPLNAITMLNELLILEEKDGFVSDKYLKQYKKDMDIQINHLLTTLSEFRSFFRPDKEPEKVKLRDLIASVELLVKDELMKDSIILSVHCDPEISIKVIKNEFKHILLNLISNSKDAFIENDIKERKISITVTQNEDETIIEFRDNAGGIPKKILPHIFEANVTSKPEGKGSGIGLYMSKQIAEKMSAKLHVQNIAKGAMFTLIMKNN